MGLYDSIDRLENNIVRTSGAQQQIAKNIANLNNPAYVPPFDKELADAQGRIDRKVLLENEMAKMSKNSIEYNTYIRLLTNKYQSLKKIASQGK